MDDSAENPTFLTTDIYNPQCRLVPPCLPWFEYYLLYSLKCLSSHSPSNALPPRKYQKGNTSSSHLVIISSCHRLILSSSHLVIISSCHHLILSSSHLVIISSCHYFISSLFYLVIISSSSHLVIISSCHYFISSSSHLVINSPR